MFGFNKYLILALMVGAALAFTDYKAYNIGKEVEAKRWLEKEIKQANHTLEVVNEMHIQARARESLHNVLLNNTRDELQEKQNEVKNRNSVINKQYRNIARLRFKLDSERVATSEARATAITAVQCNGKKITKLSRDVSQFIYDRFAECDQIVEQLTAAQSVIKSDRQIINGK